MQVGAEAHRLLRLAFELQLRADASAEGAEPRPIVVSKDLAVRLKADALGLAVEDYRRQQVDLQFTGFVRVTAPPTLVDALLG